MQKKAQNFAQTSKKKPTAQTVGKLSINLCYDTKTNKTLQNYENAI